MPMRQAEMERKQYYECVAPKQTECFRRYALQKSIFVSLSWLLEKSLYLLDRIHWCRINIDFGNLQRGDFPSISSFEQGDEIHAL